MNSKMSRWHVAWGILLLASGAVLFTNLGGYRPLTTHEVYVGQTSREMLAAGTWTTPRFLGEPRWQKPPLGYWQVMLTSSLAGESTTWLTRFPSALAGLALVVLLTVWATRRFGRPIGWWTGFIQATSVGMLTQARLAEVDMTLTFLVALSLVSYSMAVRSTRWSRSLYRLFWLAMALSLLAKGPVGPFLILPVVTLHAMWLPGKRHRWRWLDPVGIVLFLGVSLSWPVAVLMNEPNAWGVWRAEALGRFLRDPNGVVRIPFYYVVAALWLTLPWTPCWLAHWIRHARRRHSWRTLRAEDRLLVLWFLVPLVLLSLSGGKQEHYLLPALAPMSIWSARWLSRLRLSWRPMAWPRWGVMRGPGLVPACALVVVIALAHGWVLPLVHGRHRAANWARALAEHLEPGTSVEALGHSVLWLSFYVDAPLDRVDSLEEFFAKPSDRARWVLTTRRVLRDVRPRYRVLKELAPLDAVDDKHQFVLAKLAPLPAPPAAN
ncbi:Undecaprenyl phosphate-alpha-4-amino-4-deoxy-L-arabinose arabinosyl transferase [Planctomycetes bacterium Pan216]|uniref:Undecaprenyl phosphate-alpha-4-amino-4-deoxy-L-arabinose arabinosyl transferase n=1 Tax=Kolteria novifilia TaxID=2527975 RepID=A0A518AYL4_9BACT|nr:Undecaprenyl phosphate-alpha-4-amino-4-deoxy-L-arabinose arabinosyl transferase [Planctomycetes bacterium Pan216]